MKLGIITAMQSEVDFLLIKLKNPALCETGHQKFYSGTLCGKDVVIAICGIGKVNAAAAASALIMRHNCTEILNCGIVGGSAKHFKIGNIVCVESAVYGDFDTSAIGDEVGFVSGPNCIKFSLDTGFAQVLRQKYGAECKIGTVATADSFTHSVAAVERAYNLFGAACFDMEIAAIAQVCNMFKVSVISIKVVCDYADENAADSFKMELSECCKLAQEAMMEYIYKYDSCRASDE